MIFPFRQRTETNREREIKYVKTDLHHPLGTLFFLVRERTNDEGWGVKKKSLMILLICIFSSFHSLTVDQYHRRANTKPFLFIFGGYYSLILTFLVVFLCFQVTGLVPSFLGWKHFSSCCD